MSPATLRLSLPLLFLALLSQIPARGADRPGLRINWTNNLLTITGPNLPGDEIVIWYLEAFCRSGSTGQAWDKTTIPHRTELIGSDGSGKRLQLWTTVEPDVIIDHQLRAGEDEVEFNVELHNRAASPVDLQWFQPCLRVDRFTGLKQSNYFSRCFIFTERGLTTLEATRRTEEAIYRGGQVYVPSGVDLKDVNPRPLSPDRPVNGLMGCFSADNQFLLATAWDRTQELFQGVIVCIHNDPRVGGLAAGEKKRLRGKLYVMKNDPAALLKRYQSDFP